jgi:predicted transcriptional regulator
MKTFSLKLPEALATKLQETARKRHTSKSAVVREALLSFFANGKLLKDSSCYELASDLAGSLEGGPSDLSYNKKYMEGFGL